MNVEVQRLEDLLARVQRNAAALAQDRGFPSAPPSSQAAASSGAQLSAGARDLLSETAQQAEVAELEATDGVAVESSVVETLPPPPMAAEVEFEEEIIPVSDELIVVSDEPPQEGDTIVTGQTIHPQLDSESSQPAERPITLPAAEHVAEPEATVAVSEQAEASGIPALPWGAGAGLDLDSAAKQADAAASAADSVAPSSTNVAASDSPRSTPQPAASPGRVSGPPMEMLDEGEEEEEEMPPSSELVEVESIDADELEAAEPRTPPPESGPQISQHPSSLPELDPADGLMSIPGESPTMAQLGTVVELEDSAAGAEELELDARKETSPAARLSASPAAEESFEMEIPAAEFAGAYDDALASPASARQDLEEHDRAQAQREERSSAYPAAAAVRAQPPAAEPEAIGDPSATLSRAAVPATTVAQRFEGELQQLPRTFGELLSSSLSLGSKR